MEIVDLVRQYKAIKDQIAAITEREQALKTKLKELVVAEGKTDEKGSVYLDIDDEISGVGRLINQRRVSKTFDPDVAEEILEQKDLLERCTTLIPILNEEEILAARYEDQLTDADIDAMFPAKETWAFLVK